MKKKIASKKFLFGSKNYKILLIAIAVISLGFVLMSGGGSQDPNVFNNEIFSLEKLDLLYYSNYWFWNCHIFYFTNPPSKK